MHAYGRSCERSSSRSPPYKQNRRMLRDLFTFSGSRGRNRISRTRTVPCKHIKQKKPVCETSYINSTHSQYNMETPSLVLSRNLFDINPDTPRKRCRLVTQSAHFEERNVESLFAPQLSSLTHEDGIKRISFPSNRSVRFENALLKMRGGDALRRLEKERDDEIAKREQPVIRLSSVSVKTAAEIPAAATMNLGRQAPQRSRSGAARTA